MSFLRILRFGAIILHYYLITLLLRREIPDRNFISTLFPRIGHSLTLVTWTSLPGTSFIRTDASPFLDYKIRLLRSAPFPS